MTIAIISTFESITRICFMSDAVPCNTVRYCNIGCLLGVDGIAAAVYLVAEPAEVTEVGNLVVAA